ncbi:hypothetical protein [Rhizomicrobium electricum]|jgi:hypothetical protein|uniref:Uncharacterized protein n=1 Tax=Rhizomicrobium electricum TaxID=480070 RepID=A0ABP3PM81_9PROT|nr:hypothetical protein [Rhizomicrobium electricum]NIJ46859.1 hypothetical protein [Rhizomicrobium electricum]
MKTVSRRQTLWLGGSAAVLVAGGVGGRLLLRKRYAPTPYDDLIALAHDRDAAAQIGETVLAEVDDFEPIAMAVRLRARIAGRPLATALTDDVAKGHLVEGGGWVLPEMLGLICALAAKAAG